MRKILINVSTSSLACWGGGAIFLWIRGNMATLIGLAIFSVGALLFIAAFMVFMTHGVLLGLALQKRGLNLKFLDLFRRIEGAKPYQRQIWLRRSLILSLPLFFLLVLLCHQILIQNNLLAPTANLLALQNPGGDLGSRLGLTIGLEFPLGMLIYALASKDITDVLKTDGGKEVSKK